jgi:lanthanide-dependent methanol dehydrogenase
MPTIVAGMEPQEETNMAAHNASLRSAGAAAAAVGLWLAATVMSGEVSGQALAASTRGTDTEELAKLVKDQAEWRMQEGNYQGWRYSPLTQINRDNVKNLRVAWQFSTGQLRGHEGASLVIGNRMYLQTPQPGIVFALDLDHPGQILWEYNANSAPDAVPMACCDLVNRGPAYADGKIFMTTLDNRVIALDAATGKELWKALNGDYKRGETITMSPLFVKGKVIVGNSGGEYGVRGNLTAYDAADGHMLWRAYNTGPDKDVLIDPQKTLMMGKPIEKADLGVTTWPKDQWKIGGSASWGWITYDPELNLIYYGTSNPGTWNPNQRPGDNKWSTTLFARDPDTGEAKWVYQMTPHDEWDYDAVNESILTDETIDGHDHKVMVHFDRNGFAYTIDRTNGVPLVAEKYDPTVNWAKKIDLKTGLPERDERYSTSRGVENNVQGICPASVGSKDQQPSAYSPKTGLFYVPTNHLCMDYEPIDIAYVAGQPYVGAIVEMYGANHGQQLGRFIAWDAAKGKEVWEIPERWAVWSGALATGGDVVFYGTMDGMAKAVDAHDGKVLWQQRLPSGIVGYFNSFEHNGKQYVSVLSGIGGWAALGLAAGLTDPTAGLGVVGAFADLARYTNLGGTLTVFELPPS